MVSLSPILKPRNCNISPFGIRFGGNQRSEDGYGSNGALEGVTITNADLIFYGASDSDGS